LTSQIPVISIISSILLISFLSYSDLNFDVTHYAESQQDDLPEVPSVRITSPERDQLVPASTISKNQSSDIGTSTNDTLIISGTASDNPESPCDVSVLVNDVRPYRPATPKGTSGKGDYSNWEFHLTPDYAPIKQGPNKITAKLECQKLPVNLTKWYSVSVTGGTPEQVTQQEQQLQKQELEKEREQQLALEKIQLEEQRKQQMIERAKANAAKINQTELFVTIGSPEEHQYVPMGPLTISGASSDDATTDCDVYIDWNDLKPFQKAKSNITGTKDTTLTSSGVGDDYSNWTYTFTKGYHEIVNGTNEITAKLDCLAYPNNYTKFSSINVTGLPQGQIVRQQQEEQLRQQQMIERAKANAAKINQTELFVTIESPVENQSIPMDSNLTISGTSYDDATTDCDVSVVLNSKTPYQKAIPINGSGTNNYSNWTFTFTPSYGVPKEGQNEMTSKISCLAYPNNYTKFSSINVTGVSQDSPSLQQQNALQMQQQSGQQTAQQPLLQQEEKQLGTVLFMPKLQSSIGSEDKNNEVSTPSEIEFPPPI
jgi:hypothetical protein